MTPESAQAASSFPKNILRKFIPESLLKKRSIAQRLGRRAGRIYMRLCLLDGLGVRASNRRLVPKSARSFAFVCYGNIMRSAMAEFLMKQELAKMQAGTASNEFEIQITSAGLHAIAGKEAHPWAQEASTELGLALARHRAKLFTPEMAQQADCIFAMDFQNKAELLALYPESREKIFMLSAYAEGPWKDREIPDPYFGDLEITRFCAHELKTCIRNLVGSLSLT